MYKPAHVARWEARRWLALFTAIAAAMAMTLVFAGKAQADHVNSWPFSSDANHDWYWEAWGLTYEGESDWTCYEFADSAAGSDNPYTLGAAPAGETWRLLIVKKKATDEANTLYWNPVAGNQYESAIGDGYSHVIGCSRPSVTTSNGGGGSSSSDTQATTPTTAPTSTDSSVSETTVTTAPTSTDSSVSETTVTTAATTTTASVQETTVSTDSSTSATVAGTVVTTAPSSTVEDLPLTGIETGTLLGLGVALMGLGLALLVMTRKPQED